MSEDIIKAIMSGMDAETIMRVFDLTAVEVQFILKGI